MTDRGLDDIAAFYDTVIGPNNVRFAVRPSHAVGDATRFHPAPD